MMDFGHISHQQLGQLAQQAYSSPHATVHAGLSLHTATFPQLSQHSPTAASAEKFVKWVWCLSFTSPQQRATP